MSSPNNPSLTIAAEQLGPAGVRSELHIVARFPDEPGSPQERLRDRSPRRFRVAARLSRAAPANQDIRGDFTAADGSSYLLVPGQLPALSVLSGAGDFDLQKNAAGELSLVMHECIAKSVLEARHTFLRLVFPFLDRMVYLTNAPLFIETIRIEDTQNGVTTIDYVAPYRKSIVNPHSGQVQIELDPVYAMYREAKNASSDFYRFLCYYKLLEGLLGKIRRDLFKRAEDSGKTLKVRKDVIPASTDLLPQFRKYVGTTVKSFFDQVLTPQFRNAVAHFVTKDGSILNVADPEHIDRYSEIIFICELCTRVVIANHEELVREHVG